MPWRSLAQERWGNSPSGHKALGDAGVQEWNAATRGRKLPMKTEHVDLGKKGSFSVKKGGLHEMLGISEDKKIPAKDLTPHAGDSTLLRRRKASAKGFKAMHHG